MYCSDVLPFEFITKMLRLSSLVATAYGLAFGEACSCAIEGVFAMSCPALAGCFYCRWLGRDSSLPPLFEAISE